MKFRFPRINRAPCENENPILRSCEEVGRRNGNIKAEDGKTDLLNLRKLMFLEKSVCSKNIANEE